MARSDTNRTPDQFEDVLLTKKQFQDELWQKRKEAHLVHHRIADFIIHKDGRDHPPGLRNLIRKYREMMDEADEFEKGQVAGN